MKQGTFNPIDTAVTNAVNESQFCHQLLQNLKASIYTTDAEGRITFCNKAAVELWGREPVIGIDRWCGSFKILNKDGGPIDLSEGHMATTLKEGRSLSGSEMIVVRPDGQMRNVATYPEPVFDSGGKVMGAINLLVDITDLRNTERGLQQAEEKMRLLTTSLESEVEIRTHALIVKNEELKKSEERYHKMIDEVEDYAIVLLDKNGIIQNWNKGAEKIKGYKDFEIVGKSFRSFYREEDRIAGLPEKLLADAKEKGKAIHEGWRLRKDGTTFWGSIVITALHDIDRNIVGFSKVTRDLTQRKLAEEQAASYTRLLEFQNKELEQFAYAASHDLKEPLRKINFYNQYLLESLKDQVDEKGLDYLKRSVKATERMSDLIENLLTYSRLNTTDENFEMTNLNEIADDIVLSHHDLTETNQLIINKSKLPSILTIPFQFRQLMDNIIQNAIKYKHPERKTVIDINCKKVTTAEYPETSPLTDYYKLSFVDNGIGFEQQYAQRIFDIFQRLQPARYKGSGIGLAICKKIVQNHQGFIKATGTPDEGACFDVFIPCQNV
jgi:PAS domain S-box-containing protein